MILWGCMRTYLGTFHHDSSWWSRRWGGSVWWGRWHTLSQWTSLELLCLPGLCRLETENTHTHREERVETQWCCYSGVTANSSDNPFSSQNTQNLLAHIHDDVVQKEPIHNNKVFVFFLLHSVWILILKYVEDGSLWGWIKCYFQCTQYRHFSSTWKNTNSLTAAKKSNSEMLWHTNTDKYHWKIMTETYLIFN